ncbi:hypothetical protein L218DRAFT_875604 [Marasmius fiardii PR-910]|nr:hypothetical protein L218DRAFT_875604 [Marasmius fiardii PR-910]
MFNFFILIPTTLISVAISVPLSGALIRWRVHYNPNRIQLQETEEQQENPRAASAVTGYFSTLGRVYRLEGWAGLYKGFSPTFFGFLMIASALFAWLNVDPSPRLPWNLYDLGILGRVLSGLLSMVIGIPMQVFTARAIVTPYRLPYTRPFVAFKLLLSATERRQPWRIYLLPGLAASQLCLLPIPIVIAPLINLLLWPLMNTPLTIGLAAVAYFFFALACTVVQTPLQLMGNRLAVQRIHEGAGDDVSEAEVAAAAGVKTYSSKEVIALRDDQYPYIGLVDCFNKIVAEEGWLTLSRAWWITFLSFYVTALAF